MTSTDTESVPAAVGTGLGAVFGLAAKVRRDKPIHAKGVVAKATLMRSGISGRPFGVSWLDEPGTDVGTARLSRSVGLPDLLPDVLGLAVRLESDREAPADLLLATTGSAPGLRHVLMPRRDALGSSYGSLLPYDAAGTWVVLGAVPDDETEAAFTLRVARTRGPWLTFGRLVLTGLTQEVDRPIRFDPVLNPLPGLPLARPFRSLREPSYRAARRGRP